MSPQLLASEKIFTGRIFAVERDRLREANGLEVEREVVRHPGGAGALPLLDNGDVVLVRQYRHPARQGLLEIPAGRLDPGETPEQCVRREIAEEIGFRPGIIRHLSSFYSTPGFCEEMLHVFLAEDLTPVPRRPDHDEVIEVLRLPLKAAIEMIRSGEMVDAKTIIALLLAQSLIRS